MSIRRVKDTIPQAAFACDFRAQLLLESESPIGETATPLSILFDELVFLQGTAATAAALVTVAAD